MRPPLPTVPPSSTRYKAKPRKRKQRMGGGRWVELVRPALQKRHVERPPAHDSRGGRGGEKKRARGRQRGREQATHRRRETRRTTHKERAGHYFLSFSFSFCPTVRRGSSPSFLLLPPLPALDACSERRFDSACGQQRREARERHCWETACSLSSPLCSCLLLSCRRSTFLFTPSPLFLPSPLAYSAASSATSSAISGQN